MNFGVAVSQFDLGQVYEQEHKLDSATYWTLEALNYWKTVNDTSRILGLNTQLINLYIHNSQIEEATNIQSKTDELVRDDEHWYPRLNYYFISKNSLA